MKDEIRRALLEKLGIDQLQGRNGVAEIDMPAQTAVRIEIENNTAPSDRILIKAACAFETEDGSVTYEVHDDLVGAGETIFLEESDATGAVVSINASVVAQTPLIGKTASLFLAKKAPEGGVLTRHGWIIGNGEPIDLGANSDLDSEEIPVSEKDYFLALLSARGRRLARRIGDIQSAGGLTGNPVGFDFYDYFDNDHFMETWPKDKRFLDDRDLTRIFPIDRLRFRSRS